MDGIRATPMQYPILGLLADRLKRAQQFAVAPGGYANPPAEVLLNLLGVPAIQQTMERVAYGEPLTTGRGMTTQIRPEVAEAAMTLLPAAAGTARIAERGAMAAGRAGERMAERMVPQIMERGGMPAGLLEGMSSRTVSPLIVYHGSPAKFERFDPTKIGSGEGAQAYGYGHYVAESPAVAKEYQSLLSNKSGEILIDGKKLKPKNYEVTQTIARYSDDNETLRSNLSKYIAKSKENPYADIESAQLALDALNAGKNVKPASFGSFYEIDLPDEQIAKMLDWDKPLSQQKDVMAALNNVAENNVKARVRNEIENQIRSSGVLPVDQTGDDYMSLLFGQSEETIAKANQMLKQLADEQMAKIDFEPLVKSELEGMKPPTMTWDATGKEFYEMLAQRRGSPEAASTLFREQGIPGIRYLDEGSRGAGEGTSNFVVFPGNEGLLTIQKRNNEVIAPTSLLSYRGSHTAPGPDFGAPLHDLTGGGQMYPADVYSPKAAQYYGTGYPKADKEAFDLAKRVKGNPDAEVTMYRAVPNNKDITDINAGDWVTLSKDYAKTHGESVLQGDYKIISKKVKAKDLWTNADSIHEFGYHPSE